MKATVNFDGDWLPEIVINFYKLSLNERTKRSCKTFFILFSCALFSVLIPILHFFLVPGFLILSVFLSYRKFKELYSIDLSNFCCPGCKENLNTGAMPLRDRNITVRRTCNNCRKNITIAVETSAHDIS